MNKESEILEAIKLFVNPEEEPLEEEVPEDNLLRVIVKKAEPEIKIKIREPITVYLKIRKTLDGNYMIFDHPIYDIIIDPSKNKIITFAKRGINYDPYLYQDKFFDFLIRRGMAQLDSVQSGNIFGSLECRYPINDKIDTLETILLTIYQFLKDEVVIVKQSMDYDEEVSSHYTDPEDDETTELGEVPHETRKGSIDPGHNPAGLIYRL
jgi:hypothetical protein